MLLIKYVGQQKRQQSYDGFITVKHKNITFSFEIRIQNVIIILLDCE